MNFTSIATNLKMLAGGSIPGTDLLNSAEIVGVTLAGLGIVFACLVLLVFVIFLFGKIFDSINKKKAAKEAAAVAKQAPKTTPKPAAAPAPAAPAPAAPAAVVAASDDDEVIAVISAVVAAMGAAEGKTLKVRSVKPAASGSLGGRTAWAMDGRRQNVMPF